MLAREPRSDVPGALRGELGAQRHRPAAQVAAERGAAAQDVLGLRRPARAQLLEEAVAHRALGLSSPALDRHLRERGERGDLQDLAGGGPAAGLHQQHAADDLPARRDRRLCRHAGRHRDRPPAAALDDVAPQRAEVEPRAGRGDRGIQPRHHDHHRRARDAGGELGHLAEAAAAQHRLDHREVQGAQRLRKGGRRGGLPGRPVVRSHPATSTAASGWAWSVSSPDSPVRMR